MKSRLGLATSWVAATVAITFACTSSPPEEGDDGDGGAQVEKMENGGASGKGGKASGGGGGENAGSDENGGQGGGSSHEPVVSCGLPPVGDDHVEKPSGTGSKVTVLNWAGFKGAITYTFDDANSSQIAHYGELQALGVHYTFYLQTGKGDAANAIWSQAVKDGHELGNHSKSHPSTASEADVDAATDFIKSHFNVTPYTIAAPNGNPSYCEVAKTRFMINRGVSDGAIGAMGNADPFDLNCYIPSEGAPTSEFNQKFDEARNDGLWQVFLVHGFTGGTDRAYKPVEISEFTAAVEYAKSFGDMWIDSMVNVGAYWLGQMAFPRAPTSSSDDEKTWTWKLPDHFPPGKCLRVKTDGGTLKQDGKVLAWDSHGYYEVSLDDLSLTMSP